jgi:hypothetical protein
MESNIVKIKLRDLMPNPYRDFKIYPIREDKVLQLMESIRTTTFWGGLVGRKKNGKVEIAYGHHRLEALRKMFDQEAEFDIGIQNLADMDMIKMMSRENAEEWACPIAAIDDAVKAVRDHMTTHRDSFRDNLSSTPDQDKRFRIGAKVIAEFMGKKEGTVRSSLERLNLIESGEVDSEALYKMPSSAAAERFARAVKEHNLKYECQKLVADKIVAGRRFGNRTMYEVVTEFFPREGKRKIDESRAAYYDVHLRMAVNQITSLRKTLATFIGPMPTTWDFLGGVTTAEDITPETLESYNRAVNALYDSIRKVADRLDMTK